MILEACVGSVVDAIHAQANGADQIELCDRLDLDGTTPPRELVAAVCSAVTIPVKVILNPVAFEYSYSDEQLNGILAYMASLENLTVAGFVFGALDKQQMPDLEAVERIAEATTLPITFHKAIDNATDILSALDQLTQSKLVQFVLSSGGHPTAHQGRRKLVEMRDQLSAQTPEALHPIQLIAAGGITSASLSEIDQALSLKHYHGKRIVG